MVRRSATMFLVTACSDELSLSPPPETRSAVTMNGSMCVFIWSIYCLWAKSLVCLCALSKEQFEWLQTAIANWREVQTTLKEMQRLSRRVLFETVPSPPRRKRLGKKTLGLI
jgi:hypothetical protein